MKEAQAAEVVVKLFLQMAQVSELLDVVKKGKAMTGVYIYIYIYEIVFAHLDPCSQELYQF